MSGGSVSPPLPLVPSVCPDGRSSFSPESLALGSVVGAVVLVVGLEVTVPPELASVVLVLVDELAPPVDELAPPVDELAPLEPLELWVLGSTVVSSSGCLSHAPTSESDSRSASARGDAEGESACMRGD